MSLKPPPPPVKSEPGSFAWMDWYKKLYDYLNTAGSVIWTSINFAGSKLSDLASRPHAALQSIPGNGEVHLSVSEAGFVTNLLASGHAALSSILGTGSYHISSAEAAKVTALPTVSTLALNTFTTKAGYPTTTDIAAGTWALYRDSVSGELHIWANDGGTMVYSPLTIGGPLLL
jgi:hypothetical protein